MVFLAPALTRLVYGTPITRLNWPGGSLGMVGVGMYFLPDVMNAQMSDAFVWGMAAMVVTALGSSIGAVCSIRLQSHGRAGRHLHRLGDGVWRCRDLCLWPAFRAVISSGYSPTILGGFRVSHGRWNHSYLLVLSHDSKTRRLRPHHVNLGAGPGRCSVGVRDLGGFSIASAHLLWHLYCAFIRMDYAVRKKVTGWVY